MDPRAGIKHMFRVVTRHKGRARRRGEKRIIKINWEAPRGLVLGLAMVV